MKTIIEIDDYFIAEDKEKFYNLMNEHFNISKNKIEMFDKDEYVKNSSLSSEIYNQVYQDLKDEHAGEGY